MDNGSESSIAFASRALTYPERNYSQIEKKNRVLYLQLKNPITMFFGRSFKIITINKHSSDCFTNTRGYLLWLLLVYKDGQLFYLCTIISQLFGQERNKNANSMSRLSFQSDNTEKGSVLENQVLMTVLCYSRVLSDEVANHSSRTLVVSRIIEHIKNGWPSKIEGQFKSYYIRNNKLCINLLCLQRVTILE